MRNSIKTTPKGMISSLEHIGVVTVVIAEDDSNIDRVRNGI